MKPLVTFLLALGTLTPEVAQTQTLARHCGPRAEVLALLSSRFEETRQGLGLAGPASVVELFASPRTGSFTVTVTLPDGRTCILASGENWENAPLAGNEAGKPA